MGLNLLKDEQANLSKLFPDVKEFVFTVDWELADEEVERPLIIFNIAALSSGYLVLPSINGLPGIKDLNPAAVSINFSTLADTCDEILFEISCVQEEGVAEAVRMPVMSEIHLRVINPHGSNGDAEELVKYSMLGAAGASQAVTLLLAVARRSEEGYWKLEARGKACDFTYEALTQMRAIPLPDAA